MHFRLRMINLNTFIQNSWADFDGLVKLVIGVIISKWLFDNALEEKFLL